jgi:hypothetical protein
MPSETCRQAMPSEICCPTSLLYTVSIDPSAPYTCNMLFCSSTHVHTFTCTHAHTLTYTHARTHIHLHACTHTHIHLHACTLSPFESNWSLSWQRVISGENTNQGQTKRQTRLRGPTQAGNVCAEVWHKVW